MVQVYNPLAETLEARCFRIQNLLERYDSPSAIYYRGQVVGSGTIPHGCINNSSSMQMTITLRGK